MKSNAEAKSKIVLEKELPTNFEFSSISEVNDIDLLEVRKDKRLAFKKPEVYCADRCLATGHCDVYEDFLEMSVEEVLTFCEECVLSDHDEVSRGAVHHDCNSSNFLFSNFLVFSHVMFQRSSLTLDLNLNPDRGDNFVTINCTKIILFIKMQKGGNT